MPDGNDVTSMTFGNLFKQLRKEYGIGQVKMAKRLGRGQSALSKIEAGKLDPTARVLLRAYRISRIYPNFATAFERFMVTGKF